MAPRRAIEPLNETPSLDRDRRIAALKSGLFTVLVPGTVVGIVPFVLLSSRGARSPAPFLAVQVVGAIVALAGLSLYFWCLVGFVLRGLGTPSPTDPPQRLVVSGPYRLSRNPMYLAVLSMVMGEALFFRSLVLGIYAAALAAAFHAFIVAYEEPTLAHTFGSDYEAYRTSVPRWIGRRSLPRRMRGD